MENGQKANDRASEATPADKSWKQKNDGGGTGMRRIRGGGRSHVLAMACESRTSQPSTRSRHMRHHHGHLELRSRVSECFSPTACPALANGGLERSILQFTDSICIVTWRCTEHRSSHRANHGTIPNAAEDSRACTASRAGGRVRQSSATWKINQTCICVGAGARAIARSSPESWTHDHGPKARIADKLRKSMTAQPRASAADISISGLSS